MRLGLTGGLMALAAFLSAALLPVWRHWCRKVGLVDQPGARKIHEASVPLAGGLTVVSSMSLVGFLAWISMKNGWLSVEWGHGELSAMPAVVSGGIGLFLLGLCDDRFELRPLLKLRVNC